MNQYAVLFDMDGVICDTNPHHFSAFKAFFDRHQINYTQQELDDHLYGKHNSHIMTYFFKRPIHGEEFAHLEYEKEALFRELYREHVCPIPNFLEFLKDLKTNEIKTAVATSAPRANMDLIIDQLGVREQMESFLGSEDVKLHKPHPEVYLRSAQNLGVPAENCLVFEDSYSGITAGLNAGMKVVAVLSSHTKDQLPKCAYYINDYAEIDAAKVVEIIQHR